MVVGEGGADRLYFLGYRNGYAVMSHVRALAMERGWATFTEIMFATAINPGILARLLRRGVEAGLFKNGRTGYALTADGEAVYELATKILASGA
jgi:predicted transcriptional regulator